MGAKISKQIGCLSRHDDIVTDNIDVVTKAWKGAAEAVGLQLATKPLLQQMDSGLSSHKLPDIELLTLTTAYNEYDTNIDIRHSQEYIPAGRHWAADDATVDPCTSPGTPTDSPSFAAAAAEFGDIAVALENQEDSLDSWASAESQAAAAESTNQQPETAGSRPSQQQLNTNQDACAASEEGKPAATQRQDQQSVLNISVPEKEAAAAAAVMSRQHVDELFQAVDVQQQQQEKKLALLELAAAAAAASSSREVISEEEKQALREAGRAAQQAAQSQLAAALQETDKAVQQMDESSRVQWFKEHACQTAEDDAEASFEDEWSNLPPEILAMVQDLQARQ